MCVGRCVFGIKLHIMYLRRYTASRGHYKYNFYNRSTDRVNQNSIHPATLKAGEHFVFSFLCRDSNTTWGVLFCSPCWPGPGWLWRCRSPWRWGGFRPYRRCAGVSYRGDLDGPRSNNVWGDSGRLQLDTSVQPDGGQSGRPGNTHTHHTSCMYIKDPSSINQVLLWTFCADLFFRFQIFIHKPKAKI